MTVSEVGVTSVMSRSEILDWLREDDPRRIKELVARADEVRRATVGDEVHLRGLVEFGNFCDRGCGYCGIRSGNRRLARYQMTEEEIIWCAALARSLGYGTLVLQSGEDRQMEASWLADLVRILKKRFPLAVTLSVGERSAQDYRLWRNAGADRYLLKFETSDPVLFNRIHPPLSPGEPSRLDHLQTLRGLGYEIGSGIMVGIPGQTIESIAHDLQLFAELDLDMIGVGPYVPHPLTPLGQQALENHEPIPDQAPATDLMTYKVLALTRLLCPQANLPATTALATVDPLGFDGGLRAGANVIMPNLTPIVYRALYQIYPTTIHQAPEEIHSQILRSITAARRKPGQGRGDRNRTTSAMRAQT